MPDMDGAALCREIARALARRWPAHRCSSPATRSAPTCSGFWARGRRVFEKPLDPDEISRKVQTLLDDPG